MNDDYISKTISAYDESPQKFVDQTRGMIMWPELEGFLQHMKPKSTILDAGCAFGRDAKIFADKGFEVVGIDLSEELLKKGKELFPDLDLRHMDLRHLELPDEAFDGIWCNATLLHFKNEDVLASLKGFYRVLKPSGVLLVSFKEGEGSEDKLESFNTDSSRFFNYQTIDSVKKLLLDAGFAVFESHLVNERERFGETFRDLNWVYVMARK